MLPGGNCRLGSIGEFLVSGGPDVSAKGPPIWRRSCVGEMVCAQALAQACVGNDLGPLRKRQGRRGQHSGTFGANGGDLEQELSDELGGGRNTSTGRSQNAVGGPPA